MILDDLKNFFVENGLSVETDIKFDYDSTEGENVILLNLYNSLPCDLASRSSVKITVKNENLTTARTKCFQIHNLLFPEDCFQKSVLINNKVMHVKLNKGPLYQEKDSSRRHCYVLDITVTHTR